MDNSTNNQIFKNPFGLNVFVPKVPVQEIKKAIEHGLENISENPFESYFEQADKVLSGEVQAEISKYQSRIYSLGQVMREGEIGTTFNVNV